MFVYKKNNKYLKSNPNAVNVLTSKINEAYISDKLNVNLVNFNKYKAVRVELYEIKLPNKAKKVE